jgi:hypothetical protein
MSEATLALDRQLSTRRLPGSAGVAEASVMLDLFEGLGVRSISLTVTDQGGHKISFRRYKSVETLRSALPDLLLASSERQLNIIVRPIAPPRLSLIQLDDISLSQVDKVHAHSFLVLETSQANFQAWLAVKGADSNIARLIKKTAGADPNASGATRLAGSYNFKPKYAPDYPRVRLQSIAPLRTVTLRELERARLIAPDEASHYRARHVPRLHQNRRFLVWPSYSRCLADAPAAKNHEGKDRSAADFEFCLISIDRGWCVEAIANQLMWESDKAKTIGHKYALFTARRAAAVVSRNQRSG